MTPDQGFAVEVEHRVPASPETVFEYFTDPEKYRRWKGVEAELDPRPGGLYRVTMTRTPGSWIRGEYLVVEPPRRLMMTWGFEGSVELPRGMQQVPPGSSTVEFRFMPDGDGTVIRVRHLGLPTDEAQWVHAQGWNTFIPRLVAVLEGRDPGDDPSLDLAIAAYEKDARVATATDKD